MEDCLIFIMVSVLLVFLRSRQKWSRLATHLRKGFLHDVANCKTAAHGQSSGKPPMPVLAEIPHCEAPGPGNIEHADIVRIEHIRAVSNTGDIPRTVETTAPPRHPWLPNDVGTPGLRGIE